MEIKKLDVRGEICPDSLTLTMGEMNRLNRGDHLRVTLDSPMALETISRWAEKSGHRLIQTRETGSGRSRRRKVERSDFRGTVQ